MNNYILALLELKKIVTHKEAEQLADHLANKPLASYYSEALSEVKKLIDKLN